MPLPGKASESPAGTPRDFEEVAHRLENAEATLQNLQYMLALQGDALQNSMAHLERKMISGFEERDKVVSASKGVKQQVYWMTPCSQTTPRSSCESRGSLDEFAAKVVSCREGTELDNVEGFSMMPAGKQPAPAATGVQVDAVSALKGVEERLENLGTAQELQSSSLKKIDARLKELERPHERPSQDACRPVNISRPDINELDIKSIELPSSDISRDDQITDLQTEIEELQKWRGEVESRFVELEGRGYGESKDSSSDIGDRPAHSKTMSTDGTVQGVQHVSKLIEKKRHYDFQESAYDAAFFIGIDQLGHKGGVLLGIGFILNMIIQLGVVAIMHHQFLQEPFPDSVVERFEVWRTASHAADNVDSVTGTSLAARVCKGDDSLSVAFGQREALERISTYLNGGDGRNLCNLVIVLWTFRCGLELRKTLNFMLAIWRMPKGNITRLLADEGGFKIEQFSKPRAAFGVAVAICRLVMAILLFGYGSYWLALEESILELLLNASALGFVLDVDETIYGVLAPLRVQGLMVAMQPMPLFHSNKLILIPVGILVGTVAFMITINLTLMERSIGQMLKVREALCSENTGLDFVLGTSALGWLTFAKSVPYNSQSSELQQVIDAREHATQLLIDGNPEAELFVEEVLMMTPLRSVTAIVRDSTIPLSTLASKAACVDLASDPASTSDVKLGARLWIVSGNETLRNVTSCNQVEYLCRGPASFILAQNVRFMCPITCGCANSKSGLWDLALNEAGCPQSSCHNLLLEEAYSAKYDCEDTNLTDLKSSRSWSSMLRRMHSREAINTSVLSSLQDMGCNAFADLNPLQREYLCQTGWEFHEHGLLGAATICPVSCGCIQVVAKQTLLLEASEVGWSGLCPREQCQKDALQDWMAGKNITKG